MAEVISMIQMRKKQHKSLGIALATYCSHRTLSSYSLVILAVKITLFIACLDAVH